MANNDWLSSLLGGAGSAIAAALGVGGASAQSQLEAQVQRENVDKTNAANLRLANLAFDRNRQQWMEANAYNSPVEQMARLRMAGLNPNLVYGSGAVGNAAGGIPQFQAPRSSYDYKAPVIAGQVPAALSSFMDFQMRQAQLDNVKAQTAAVQTKTVNDVIQGRILNAVEYRQPDISGWWNTRSRAALNQYEQRDLPGYPFQLEVLKNQARMSQLATDKILQDILYAQYRNDWMKQGVTTSDHPIIRFGARALGSAGADLQKFIREHSPFK